MHIDKITDKSDYNGSVKFNYLHEYVPRVYLHACIQIRAMVNTRSVCNAILVVQFKSMSFAISILYDYLVKHFTHPPYFNRPPLALMVNLKTGVFFATYITYRISDFVIGPNRIYMECPRYKRFRYCDMWIYCTANGLLMHASVMTSWNGRLLGNG
jgi:hypothetical protein